ncbi:MAG: tRNA uridine-5-carboxymethylaminomethyl(34) synthesis GTPase MnmE [Bacteroidales bacterium]|nr:tRNA uridine-5-carboxymethylaminomethyl(34) synthesis GTPase MnmE [Bacteroidales bacterium]
MTICALSTPSGIGGIAVVRISGPDAISSCARIFRPYKATHTLDLRPSHTLTFGKIIHPESDEVLDEVVVSLFRAPQSYTGEDVVEISCHGSLYIQQELLHVLIRYCGVRMAEGGEFTRRAFANGRMDLSQAEAVADLISAQNAAAHRLAYSQMKGSVSRKLDGLHDQLLRLSSLLELELDFSEEDVEFADRTELLDIARQIDAEIVRLSDTFRTGQAIRNGIPVAIIGETNVGKSTLLNHLLGDERAIVSDVHGTTRDVIEDTILLDGQLIRFIDTAGIRDTSDQVETMGIERTYQRLQRAQIVLWLIDGTRLAYPSSTESCIQDTLDVYHRIEPYLKDQQLILVINKIDLVPSSALHANLPRFQQTLNETILHSSPYAGGLERVFLSLSAKHELGFDNLRDVLVQATRLPQQTQGDVILTNQRHYEAMQEAHAALQHVIDGLQSHLSGDLVAEDLHAVIDALNSVLGRSITSQDTLNNIFKNFCIGK